MFCMVFITFLYEYWREKDFRNFLATQNFYYQDQGYLSNQRDRKIIFQH